MTCDIGIDVPATVGLVADDFTGAADSAGVFALHGWTVRLLVGAGDTVALEPHTVLAVATGARSLSETDAAVATADAVRRLAASGVERLFLKIDSTMRGPISAQVRGAVEAWSERHPGARALVAPAFPAQGRTVVDGLVLVDGVPVTETASGRDPFSPVTSSDLATLLPGYEQLPAANALSSVPVGTYADAATDGDLDAVARLIDPDPAVVAIGSAGLASALARRWKHAGATAIEPRGHGDVVVAVASLHPVSARQVRELSASGYTDIDVLTTPTERDPSSEYVAGELARRVKALVQTRGIGSLIIVGGDGVAAILAELGASSVVLDDVLEAGCPTGRIVGGLAHGVRLVSKSGGFGSPCALVDLVSLLRPSPPPSGPLTAPFTRPVHPKEDHND